MALQIPENQKKTLETITALSDDKASQLVGALEKASPAISPSALAKQLHSVIEMPLGRLTGILTVLISLTLARIANHKSIEQITTDVAETAATEGIGGLVPETERVRALQARLAALLTSGATSLEVTSRAFEVYFAHSTLFRSARVFSDIRTIFGAENVLKPAAGMIVHTLQLKLGRDGKSSSEYVALNIHDLKELRGVIDRAVEKDSALRAVIEAGGMTYMEDTPNPHQT